MITTAKFINTANYEIELTIKMTVADWESLKDQLQTRWPSGKLSDHIGDALRKLSTSVRVLDDGTVI